MARQSGVSSYYIQSLPYVELFQWGRMSRSVLYWIVRKSDSLLYCGQTSESLIHNLDNSSDRNGYAVHVASVQSERTAEPDRQSDS
jgi:hypothetical protein